MKMNLELKKLSREKVIIYMLNGKVTIILLTVGLKKRHSINEWIFYKTYTFDGNVKIELDLSNYATKEDFKKCYKCNKSKLAK